MEGSSSWLGAIRVLHGEIGAVVFSLILDTNMAYTTARHRLLLLLLLLRLLPSSSPGTHSIYDAGRRYIIIILK